MYKVQVKCAAFIELKYRIRLYAEVKSLLRHQSRMLAISERRGCPVQVYTVSSVTFP